MKKLISLALAFLLVAVNPCAALTKQVTTVSAVSAVVFTPGGQCQWVTIANTGSGAVMLSFDGTDPTATVGYPLAAGEKICIVYAGSNQKSPIRAILQTGTTTSLNFNTPDSASQ